MTPALPWSTVAVLLAVLALIGWFAFLDHDVVRALTSSVGSVALAVLPGLVRAWTPQQARPVAAPPSTVVLPQIPPPPPLPKV